MIFDEHSYAAAEEDREAMLVQTDKWKGNSRYRNSMPIEDDQTTQYSVQASILTRKRVPQDNLSAEYSNTAGGANNYSDSISQRMGKSGNPKLNSLRQQLSTERVQRKQMERELAQLLKA